MQDHITKFLIGAFGSFLIIMFRDVPSLPGLSHFGYWWVRAIFVVAGGLLTIVWQIGDDSPLRSFYFGATWPALISLVTLSR
jgi:hypothetical protein